MMSIRPESLWTEARMLLQPDLLVFTNFRCDHREHWGHTRGDVLSALRSAITPGCKVFLPEEEDSPDFQEAAAEIGADQVLIPPLGQEELQSLVGDISSLAFEPNLRLAAAVAQHLGIDREQALSALKRSVSDADGLKVWGFGPDKPTRSWYFVNAFAANEPESTRLVLDKLHAFSGLEYSRVFAVLNLRSDRPDRTQQWLEAVQRDEFPEIVRFYVSGRHARAFKQKACRSLPDADIHVLKKRTAAEVFDVLSAEAAGAMVLGMGNLGGLGGCLVEICRSKGIPHVV
jgi:poly-gamma-glutamate synthase PgsB/CapB